jgi:hypothetical protein
MAPSLIPAFKQPKPGSVVSLPRPGVADVDGPRLGGSKFDKDKRTRHNEQNFLLDPLLVSRSLMRKVKAATRKQVNE